MTDFRHITGELYLHVPSGVVTADTEQFEWWFRRVENAIHGTIELTPDMHRLFMEARDRIIGMGNEED